jgi:hypothetical protein
MKAILSNNPSFVKPAGLAPRINKTDEKRVGLRPGSHYYVEDTP